MINSYNDIKSKVEELYEKSSPNDFISICNAALGGKRGLNRTQLIQVLASNSVDRIHGLLEPLVEELIAENKRLSKEQDEQYNVVSLGGGEYRLIKIMNKDKYGRGAEDYIIDTGRNTCTCPEFTNRLRNLFLPCKHQYMLETTTAAVVQRLVVMADKLDGNCFHNEANKIDRILIAAAPIPKRKLGNIGNVTVLGLGGESILSMDEHREEAVALIRRAMELGINYFDTAPTYGSSELRLGEAFDKKESEKIFIATKTEDRTRDGSLKVLENSLKRLRRDWIDLWQIHHLESMKDIDKVFSKGGCLEALLQAKEEGLVKHIGITGHYDPEPVIEAIKRFDFDTVLIAANASDVHHRSFIKSVLPIAEKKKMGIIGMKVCSRGRLFEPIHLRTMKEAFSYVLNLPISTAIIGHDDIRQLEENIQIAKEFQPLTDQEVKELEDKTKDYVELSQFYKKDFEKFNPFWEVIPY